MNRWLYICIERGGAETWKHGGHLIYTTIRLAGGAGWAVVVGFTRRAQSYSGHHLNSMSHVIAVAASAGWLHALDLPLYLVPNRRSRRDKMPSGSQQSVQWPSTSPSTHRRWLPAVEIVLRQVATSEQLSAFFPDNRTSSTVRHYLNDAKPAFLILIFLVRFRRAAFAVVALLLLLRIFSDVTNGKQF